MTKIDFLALCGEALISPDIALENEGLREALANRDDAEVRRILTEEF